MKYFYYFLSIVSLYLLGVVSFYYISNNLILPHPNQIINSFIELISKSHTYYIIILTMLRLVLCIIISFILGCLLGLLSYRFNAFKHFIHPYMVIFRSIPLASIIIILLMVIGYKLSPFIVTILVLLPIIYTAVLEGLNSIDKNVNQVWKLDSNFNF